MTRALRLPAALSACLLLTGCATLQKPETYAACAAADTVSTYLAIKAGATEANPAMASVIAQGWIPFLAVQAGIAYIIYRVNNDALTAAGSSLKCGVAASNLTLVFSRPNAINFRAGLALRYTSQTLMQRGFQ